MAREGPRDPGHAKPGAEPDPRNRKTLGKNSPLNARGHLSHAASRKAGQLSRMKCWHGRTAALKQASCNARGYRAGDPPSPTRRLRPIPRPRKGWLESSARLRHPALAPDDCEHLSRVAPCWPARAAAVHAHTQAPKRRNRKFPPGHYNRAKAPGLIAKAEKPRTTQGHTCAPRTCKASAASKTDCSVAPVWRSRPPDAAPLPPGPTAKQNAPAFRPGRLEFPERTISRALR